MDYSDLGPQAQEFMAEIYPRLSEEQRQKVDAVLRDYGVGHRFLTPAEIEEAGQMLLLIVKDHLQSKDANMKNRFWETHYYASLMIPEADADELRSALDDLVSTSRGL